MIKLNIIFVEINKSYLLFILDVNNYKKNLQNTVYNTKENKSHLLTTLMKEVGPPQ